MHPAFAAIVITGYMASIANVVIEPNLFDLATGCGLGAYIGIYYSERFLSWLREL